MTNTKKAYKDVIIKKLEDFTRKNFPETHNISDHTQNIFLMMDSFNLKCLELLDAQLTDKQLKVALKNLGINEMSIDGDPNEFINNYCKESLIYFIKTVLCHIEQEKRGPNEAGNVFNEYNKLIKTATVFSAGARDNTKFHNKPIRDNKESYFIDPYNLNTFSKQFTEQNLPSVKNISKSEQKFFRELDNILKRKRNMVNVRPPVLKSSKVCFYNEDLKDIVAIRQKASTEIKQPNKTIDYYSEEKFELKNIKKEVDMLDNIQFDADYYKKFELRGFINEILYTRNSITIPKNRPSRTIEKYKQKYKSKWGFFNIYLDNELTRLILQQDEYLTLSEAKMLAKEFKCNLRVEDYDYFYENYLSNTNTK